MFQKAERKKAKLRLALCGPSGSGKTYGALQLAKGLGGKIAMIDTEHGSGELYADLCDYDVARLDAPFSPDRYIEMIQGAEAAGYDVLIVDSLSHAWTGEGGVLDLHDKAAAASRSGNGFAAWREVTPKHNALVTAILTSGLHIITTMRTKTAYEIVENDKGRKEPRKIGLAPVQRDGMEYEFTVVLDLSVEKHIASASKDRTQLFNGRHMVLSPEVGSDLRDWLESGIDLDAVKRQQADAIKARIAKCLDVEALTALYSEAQATIHPARERDLWEEIRGEFKTRGEKLKTAEERVQ